MNAADGPPSEDSADARLGIPLAAPETERSTSELAISAWVGAIAGLSLVAIRAPSGTDWTSPGPHHRSFVPLVAWLSASVCISWADRRLRARFSLPACLAGACAAIAVHALVLDPFVPAATLAFAVLFAAIAPLAVRTILALKDPPPYEHVDFRRPFAILGWMFLAPPVGSALRGIWRSVEPVAGRSESESALAGAVFAALVALGAAAAAPVLSPLVRRARASAAAGPVLVALAVLACLDSSRVVAELAHPEHLERFFSGPPWRFTLDDLGRLGPNAVIVARAFLLPAFALGAAWSSSRFEALTLVPIVALGWWFDLWNWPAGAPFGAAFLVLLAPGVSRASRAVSLAGLAALAMVLWDVRFEPPRLRDPRIESGTISTPPIGSFRRVEIGRVPSDHLVVELDGFRCTPVEDEEPLERAALSRAAGAKRVLLVGPLTPNRDHALRAAGVELVERFMPAEYSARLHVDLEEALFGPRFDLESFGSGLRGADDARQRALRGEYETVIVPPVFGFASSYRAPELPEGTRFYGWLDADSGAAEHEWSECVDFATDGERLWIAIGNHEFASGEPLAPELPIVRLQRRAADRARRDRLRAAERLQRAAEGGEHAMLFDGLALHFAAQVESSPFETPEQRVELDDRALELLRDAALAQEPPAALRGLWNAFARILAGKRDLERIERFLRPLAERHEPWPQLERALAHADLEMLAPASAARRLAIAIAAAPDDVELRGMRGRALLAAEQPAEAARELEAALALAPEDSSLRRDHAIALVRAGDPRGRELVDELLRDHPDDPDLRAHAGPGPYPPIQPRFAPGR